MTEANQKKIFSHNLSNLLAERRLSQKEVADAIGVIPQTFNRWMQGLSLPRMDKVQKLADYFHIKKSDLIDQQTESAPLHEDNTVTAVRIPVYGRVAAGIPMDAIEDVIDFEDIPADMSKGGEYFALQIKGDSMKPRMFDGDVVIVRKQPDAETGDTVIALINGNDACCKRLRKYYDGAIDLISTNPNYEPIHFSREDIEREPVKILGKVVENRQKY